MLQQLLRIPLVIGTIIVLGGTNIGDVLANHITIVSNLTNNTIPFSDSAEVRRQALEGLSMSSLDKEKKMHQQLLQQGIPANSNMSQTDIQIANQSDSRINEQIDTQIEGRITPADPVAPSNTTNTNSSNSSSPPSSASPSSSSPSDNEDEPSAPSYSVSPSSSSSSSNDNDEMNRQDNQVSSSSIGISDMDVEFGSILCDFVLVNGQLSLDDCTVIE